LYKLTIKLIIDDFELVIGYTIKLPLINSSSL
jgi:hypothetical protein